jgi:hypothetical protein
MTDILFILKRKDGYNCVTDTTIGLSTGLYNSASFVSDMLNSNGIKSEIAVAIDNNCIDRIVSEHSPSFVIIEALWVVPDKFSILQKLHPHVTWIIRLHSETPFMAGEGIAMDWVGEYLAFKNVLVAVNSPRMYAEINTLDRHINSFTTKVIYLPNCYPTTFKKKSLDKNKDTIDIGCFGAVRPLKNHLMQAFAAIEFADIIGKKLNFHINASRVEMNGQPVVRNIVGLFGHVYYSGHRLINHPWQPRDKFLELCGQMDIGMQVSFSETYNIVGADIISQGVPLVGSKEIPWQVVHKADPTCSKDIVRLLKASYNLPSINTYMNQHGLKFYNNSTEKIWLNFFKGN